MLIEVYPDEVHEVLGNPAVPVATRDLLARLVTADGEGVSRIPHRALASFLRAPRTLGGVAFPAGDPLLRRTIERGIEHGLYAPGSTPAEVGLMLGRRAEEVDLTA